MSTPVAGKALPRFRTILLLFGLIIGSSAPPLYPQEKKQIPPREPEQAALASQATLLNINNITMWANSNGTLERRLSDFTAGVRFPRGTANVVYAGGILWGGQVVDGAFPTLRVGGQTYSAGIAPGAILSPGRAEDIADPSVRVYRIRRDWATADLTQDASEYFGVSQLDVTEEMIDSLREQYRRDWLEWPWQKGAPYYERNGIPGYQAPTGEKYDPTEDEPGLADADEVLWMVANDLSPTVRSLYGSPSIGIELQITCWAFKERSDLQNTIFERYRIIYKGTAATPPYATISPMYLSKWVDPDIGTYSDDFVGSDPDRGLGFAYNARPTDTEFDNFLLAPPAIGYALVQGPRIRAAGSTALWDLASIGDYANLPMKGFTYFTQSSRTSDFDLRTYNGTLEWWNIFNGYSGSPIDPPQCLTDPVSGLCNPIELSGDPLTFQGSVDGRMDPAGDRRFAMVAGPFSMALGDTQEVVVALVGAQGKDNRDAVGVLKDEVDHVRDAYRFHFVDPAPVPLPPLHIVELDKRLILDWESDTARTKLVETYHSKGYQFEGYKIYQFPSLTASHDQGVLLAPFDITLPRSRYIDDDALRHDHQLVNGQEYYFAVTSTMYNPTPGIALPRIESPVLIQAARPHAPDPGIVYPYPLGDNVTSDANLRDTYGSNDARVNTVYFDPSRSDDHTYRFRFHRDANSNQKGTWDFIDISEFQSGIAIGGGGQEGPGQAIIQTTDGGTSWGKQATGFTSPLYGVSMPDVFTANAVGAQGTIFRTTDAGDHWVAQTSGTSVPLYAVAMLDTGKGMAVGGSGTILLTTDGGNAWFPVRSPVSVDLHGAAWADKFRGLIVGTGGVILHTIIGGFDPTYGTGYGWYVDASPTQEDLYAAANPEINIEFAAGRNGTIVRTIDGGFTWTLLQSGTTSDLYGMQFVDENTGVAVGSQGTILRTTDRGLSWVQQASATAETLFAVSFTDAATGTVVGSNGVILRTTDAGQTWLRQPGGVSSTLRSVSMTDENPLVKGANIDSPPHRVIERGLTVEAISPYLGIKGVYETETNFQPTRSPVFNRPNPGGNYMVVGKGYSNIDTVRGGSNTDVDIELRFTGDSSWTLFRGINVPQSRWVRVPFQAWQVSKIGRDSVKRQVYTTVSREGGDSVWRAQVLLDRSYNGKTLKEFYPITIVVDSSRTDNGFILGSYDDSVAYTSAVESTKTARRELKGYLWGMTQSQSDVTTAIWEAYIADVDGDGIAAPLGTIFRFEKYHKIRDREEKTYTPLAVQRDNRAAALREVDKINVFPNPYYAFNRAEVNSLSHFVRFNHLPYGATIRIFNLAGVLVRTIRKEDETQFADWDLNNERGLPAASGVYLAYLELNDKTGAGLGAKSLKLMIVQQAQEGN